MQYHWTQAFNLVNIWYISLDLKNRCRWMKWVKARHDTNYIYWMVNGTYRFVTELFLLFETPCDGVCFELVLRDTFDLLTFIVIYNRNTSPWKIKLRKKFRFPTSKRSKQQTKSRCFKAIKLIFISILLPRIFKLFNRNRPIRKSLTTIFYQSNET